MGRKELLENKVENSFWMLDNNKNESQDHIEQTNHEKKLLDGEKCQETKRFSA